jgi:hypothetical protein
MHEDGGSFSGVLRGDRSPVHGGLDTGGVGLFPVLSVCHGCHARNY